MFGHIGSFERHYTRRFSGVRHEQVLHQGDLEIVGIMDVDECDNVLSFHYNFSKM